MHHRDIFAIVDVPLEIKVNPWGTEYEIDGLVFCRAGMDQLWKIKASTSLSFR